MDSKRVYGLDALRSTMMLLGFVVHSAYFYIIYKLFLAKPPNGLLLLITGLIHRFRMPLFFLLGGFFAALLVSKYGMRAAYLNRVKRILVPFVLASLTIVPLTLWGYFSMVLTALNGEMSFMLSRADFDRTLHQMMAWKVPTISFMHLWFLHYLLAFYLLIPLCELLVEGIRRTGWEPRVGRLLEKPWMILVFSTLTALTLWKVPMAYVGIDDKSLIPDVTGATYYGVFFVVGYLFFHYREILPTFQRHTVLYGVLAVILFIGLTAPMMMKGGRSPTGHFVTVACSALCSWTAIYCLMGWFLRIFQASTPRIGFLSRSLYWVYLVHVPLIFIFGVLLTPLPLNDLFKFLILTTLTCVTSFATYLLIRGTWINTVLNGKWTLSSRRRATDLAAAK
jgi:glucan biosynthesis protein C